MPSRLVIRCSTWRTRLSFENQNDSGSTNWRMCTQNDNPKLCVGSPMLPARSLPRTTDSRDLALVFRWLPRTTQWTRSRKAHRRSPTHLGNRTVCLSSTSPGYNTLVMYTKPGCPLCTRLQEKIQALLDRAQFLPSTLTSVNFEVVDISGDEHLVGMYDTRVPVLGRRDQHGKEEILPQFSPRMTAERLGTKLEPFFGEQPSAEG